MHFALSRLAYCVMFVLQILAIWGVRDGVSTYLSRVVGPGIPPTTFNCTLSPCLVPRVSFGYALFHLLLALIFLYRRDDKQLWWQEELHHRMWWLKIPLLVAIQGAIFFYLPSLKEMDLLEDSIYYVQLIGSGFFLLVQCILLVDFAYTWHETWVSYDTYLWDSMTWLTTIFFNLLSLAAAGVMIYYFYMTDWIDIFVISETVGTCLLVTLISIHPRIERGSPLTSSVLFLYCMMMVATAILSKHSADDPSNFKHADIYVVTLSCFSAAVAVIYSSLYFFSAHRYIVDQSEEDTSGTNLSGVSTDIPKLPYDLTKFHLVFALAGWYLGMVFTNWKNIEEQSYQDELAYWLKFAVQSMTILLYAWSLLAPLALSTLQRDSRIASLDSGGFLDYSNRGRNRHTLQ